MTTWPGIIAPSLTTLTYPHDQGKNRYGNSGHLATGSGVMLNELPGNQQARVHDGSMNQWTQEKRPAKRLIRV